jgi:D-3-phosphoglycerate dehydrogenase
MRGLSGPRPTRPRGPAAIAKTASEPGPRVFLVSLAEDADLLPLFRAAFTAALLSPARFDVGFAHQVPAGPGIVGLAVAPPVELAAGQLAALPGLRAVAAVSAGYDHVDAAALAARGIPLSHAPGYCDIEVADHAIAMTCALLRNLHVGDAHVRAGGWSSRAVRARRVSGATLGIAGLGRTGRLVALRAVALGMHVLAWAPRTPPETTRSLGATPVETLPELLGASDVVSLHVPLTADTEHLIDTTALAAMRPGASLVNCGRGGLVDTGALRAALAAGHLSGAALDVLDEEPPGPGHLARTLPRTILTPHMAWLSPESEYAAYELAAASVATVLSGQVPPHVVPPGSLGRVTACAGPAPGAGPASRRAVRRAGTAGPRGSPARPGRARRARLPGGPRSTPRP